ncbi:MAG: phasin family protein [Lysobacteraceae bacterium]|nr:MAG: phasin family protein [Xanthomonadaceae bacterium]
MTSISDQFSAVRKAQFDAQFDFFNSFTTQALDSAGRLAALNLTVSREAVQRSLGAGLALASSRDPRDIFALGGQAEEQMRNLFAYGRELLGIASSLNPPAVRPQALGLASLQAGKLAAETVEVFERSVTDAVQAAPAAAEAAVAPAPAEEAPHPVAAFASVAEPVVVAEPEAAQEAAPQEATEALAAEPVPVAEPTAIAKAIGKGTARAAAAPHPAAAPVAELAASEPVAAPKLAPAAQVSKRKK